MCQRPHAHGLKIINHNIVNPNIQLIMVDSPSCKYFANIAINIGSSAFVIACVYQPNGSWSDAFCDEF